MGGLLSFLIVFLDSLLSQRMMDGLGCLPCTFVTLGHSRPLTIVTSFEEKAQSGSHSWLNVFLDSLLSQRMTDGLGCLPCTFVTPAHSPSSPLLRKRRKAWVHAWLIVYLDSLLSQRMTEWGAYPAPSPTHHRHLF